MEKRYRRSLKKRKERESVRKPKREGKVGSYVLVGNSEEEMKEEIIVEREKCMNKRRTWNCRRMERRGCGKKVEDEQFGEERRKGCATKTKGGHLGKK